MNPVFACFTPSVHGLHPLMEEKKRVSKEKFITYKPRELKWDPKLLLPKEPWPAKSGSFTVRLIHRYLRFVFYLSSFLHWASFKSNLWMFWVLLMGASVCWSVSEQDWWLARWHSKKLQLWERIFLHFYLKSDPCQLKMKFVGMNITQSLAWKRTAVCSWIIQWTLGFCLTSPTAPSWVCLLSRNPIKFNGMYSPINICGTAAQISSIYLVQGK